MSLKINLLSNLDINPSDQNNFLLEGDNLDSLSYLKKSGGKVDVIYIDPPYNTGKQFIYNDKIVSNKGKHKHSKWLSFMKPRLELAKELLSEDGIIFISIDDHEQAYLKVLMDEIFGEENFVSNFSYKRGVGANLTKYVRVSREHVLSYAKNKPLFKMNPLKTNKKKGDSSLSNPGVNRETTLIFPKNTIRYLFNKSFNQKELSLTGDWKWTQKKLNYELLRGTKIIAKTNSLKLRYLKDEWSRPLPENDISDLTVGVKTNLDGSSMMNRLGMNKDFDTPKSTTLLKWLVDRHTNKNATVLDFFAGSGTTGQAVMELNQEDGGNRRFILCTNNEMKGIDTKKYPEKGIARAICRERIYRVINGVGSNGEKVKWKYTEEVPFLKNNSVKYIKVDYDEEEDYE